MKVVVVEDRPWHLAQSIKDMREKGIAVTDVVFVLEDDKVIDEDTKANIRRLQDEVRELHIEEVYEKEFMPKMNSYYADKENMILCDFNLRGSDRVLFEKRINVIFAKRIIEKEGLPNSPLRMWFYTGAGEMTNEQINDNFPEHNISVLGRDNQQVLLDINEILSAITKIEEMQGNI